MTTLQYLQFACIRTFVNTIHYIRRSPWMSPSTQPNFTNIYNEPIGLYPARIFLPKGQDTSKPLPLVICVHGGGFMVNNPSVDDPLARQLADEAGCIVISIDYRKSPQSRFPAAYEDVVQQALTFIDSGEEVLVDRSRVVLCGSSAGGNLVLGAAQDRRLKGKMLGVVGLYPLCDFRPSWEERMATRPDPSVPDFLGKSIETVGQLYLRSDRDVDLADPRLSPTTFKSREDLPKNVLIFGVEHDMLRNEAEVMAEKLADGEKKVDVEDGWETEGVKWCLVKGQTHAFDHFAQKDPERERSRVEAKERTYGMIVDWLKEISTK